MIKIENVLIEGFEPAIRAMRNPMNSWEKSDSRMTFIDNNIFNGMEFTVGHNDLDLMQRLAKAGVEHATYRRMIVVWLDITAPLYWWKEMDRYTVGKTQISCSTMHKIAAKEFELDDFSHEHLFGYSDVEEQYEDEYLPEVDIVKNEAGIYPFHLEDECMPAYGKDWLRETCKILNAARDRYLETKDKKYWWQMIQLLPSSYNQKRTIMLNYEVLAKIYRERKDHKLDEWRSFCDWIKTLPYAKEVITLEND